MIARGFEWFIFKCNIMVACAISTGAVLGCIFLARWAS